MTRVTDIHEFIDSFAPFSSAEPWDNVGVLVGDSSAVISKAIVSLDITTDVLDEAKVSGAQLVISHHPIIFGGIKNVMVGTPVYKAVSQGITCLCAHTNLDKSPVFGVNICLAETVGLIGCHPSDDNELLFIAETKGDISSRELAETIKKNLSMSGVCFTDCGKKIHKVGMCSGAGGSEIFSAIDQGCDAFITGEIKHHELLAANSAGMSVFILGHYKSEDVVIQPLVDKLSQRFPDVEFVKSKEFSDGVFLC